MRTIRRIADRLTETLVPRGAARAECPPCYEQGPCSPYATRICCFTGPNCIMACGCRAD